MKKSILLTVLLSVLVCNTSWAREIFTTYEVVDQRDEPIAQVLTIRDTEKREVREHWVFYPNPSWKAPDAYPDPSWKAPDAYPDPSWRTPDSYPDPSWMTFIKVDNGFRSLKEFQMTIQKGDRYFKKVSSEVRP